MSHVYSSLLVHCVFSTKNRQPLITAQYQPRLWAYMGGIARTNNFKALAVGGVEDHAHILLSLPPTITVSKAVQLIKGGSSKWFNDQQAKKKFAWQDAYGAFSIGVSQIKSTVTYINNQKAHHARTSFDQELKMFLRKHGISVEWD